MRRLVAKDRGPLSLWTWLWIGPERRAWWRVHMHELRVALGDEV